MHKQSRIYIAGHLGMVGSAVTRALRSAGYENLLLRTHEELDLADQLATQAFFRTEQPEYVLLAAAKVGGIHANDRYPADFIYKNLIIQANVLEASRQHGAQRLLFLGSSCIYPRACPQPIREEYLLTGPLEPTNRPYAIAKISGIEQCWAYNRQYGTRFLSVMPSNLYGPDDHYDLENSHVIPALIRKFHEAKISNAAEAFVWGSGLPRREFLFSDDLADACMHLLSLEDEEFDTLLSHTPPLVNIGTGQDLTIQDLADIIKSIVGFQGKLHFDSQKPDGTPRKLLDTSRLTNAGWRAKTSLHDGLRLAYADYLKRYSATA